MGLSRRRFTREFKLAAIQRLEQGISIAEVARALEVNPNVLHRWRSEFRQGPGNAVPGRGQRRWSEGRIAELERKIGQQTLEIDSDCQWLQYLHSVGLLRASFRPTPDICAIRSLLRHRDSLVEMATSHVQHMQKALDQMNLQIHHVISDITGTTGLAIMDAILGGERDAQALATLRDPRIRASQDTIAKSLVGDYGMSICSRCGNPSTCTGNISDESPPVRKKCSG
jgi:transposase-like protein